VFCGLLTISYICNFSHFTSLYTSGFQKCFSKHTTPEFQDGGDLPSCILTSKSSNTIFSRLSNLELYGVYSRSYVSLTGLFKEPIIRSLQYKMADLRHLENQHDVICFCRCSSHLDKISHTGTEWHVNCGDVWKWKPDVEFQYGGRLGEFSGMSCQSHVSHCMVLPLGEFTITIPVPHATLQGAVTWRNQCRDRATLQRVRIPSGIMKISFRPILLFFVFMQFRLWRVASFVSSAIHLFNVKI